jgi:hypothetical protein
VPDDKLTSEQREILVQTLLDLSDLFATKISHLTLAKVPPFHIDLLPDARPTRTRPYRLSLAV